MQIESLMKETVKSDFYRSQIGSGYQLGWPMFTVYNGRMCLCFLPHIERLEGQELMTYYQPQYKIVLTEPFRRVVRFDNLAFLNGARCDSPVCTVGVDKLLGHKDVIVDLFKKASELIERGDADPEALAAEYFKQFRDAAREIGIESVYGGYYDSHRDI